MRYLLSICLLVWTIGLRAQVTVQVNVVQPVPPYLPQIKADIAGNRVGMLNQDISSHLSIVLRYTGRAAQRIKLAGSIERVAPSPIGVSLRPDYQPAQAIVMGPQQPIISLSRDMLQTAFGNFSENSLVWNNLDLNTLRQNGIDYKLPEGTYRVCVTAYDYDRPGFSMPLSPPGTGCAYFTICYTAAAPQLILPVSTMLQSNSQFQDLVPHSTQVQFLWTPPATTCGVPVGALNYDLEIRRVFEGQTVSDAQSNPFVFHQQNIPTTSFFLDTLKYPHVLVPGQKYTIRVRANFMARVGSPLQIANQGYSQIAAIDYKAGNAPFGGMFVATNKPIEGPVVPISPGSILPGGYIVESYSPGGVCPATLPISNTTVLTGGIGGQDLTIGSFRLHVDEASANGDGSYKGGGYITWHPLATDIRLKVSFDTLRVNTDKVVFGGTAYTSTDGSHPLWAPFGAIDPVAKLTGLGNSDYEAIETRISDGAHLVNQLSGNDEVDFPLGLNTTLGTTPVTMAIMGISFKPACTNMNVLLNVNCPDLGGWLSLGGTGLQADPNKVLLAGSGGVLYLPQEHKLPLGGMSFAFDGCPGAGTSAVDTSKGTYVQWDGSRLGAIVVNADVKFGGSSIVAVDDKDQRLTDPAAFHAKFSFTDWNDWMASVKPINSFELGALPGFMISSTGGWYDHSMKQNPTGMTFPSGYAGATDAGWQGFYLADLTMQLPPGLTGSTGTKFGFHPLILDNTGVSTTISVDKILDLSTGSLGGWAFSIDHIGIGILQDNFLSGMQMTGGIRLPLSDDPLAYTCNLSVGEGTGMNYQFAVTPKGNYNVNMWTATLGLQPNSALTISNKGGAFVITAKLNGSVSIDASKVSSSLPNVKVTALSFQGMTITNNDPATHAFAFDPGNWSFGGKPLVKTAMNAGVPGGLAGGPAAEDGAIGDADVADGDAGTADGDGKVAMAPFDDGSGQGSADGFSLNFTGFKPYVKLKSSAADIGMTFTMNAVLDESGLGIGGSATMDIYGNVDFSKGRPVLSGPSINLDSIGIDCNLDLFHVSGGLAFKHNDATFGDDVKGSLDLTILGTIDVSAAAIFGHTLNSDGSHGYNYWGLAAQSFWEQGIVFPPGLSLNGLGGGFHYNMSMGAAQKKITSSADVSSPEAIVNELIPKAGTLGFDAQAILAYLSPNVICFTPTLEMDFSTSHGLEMMRFAGDAEILSSSPPTPGAGVINATATATFIPNPMNFNCTLDVDMKGTVISINAPVQFNVGDGGNYLYIGTPAPPGTGFHDDAIKSMVSVQVGFDEAIVHADLFVYGYFDIGTQLPSSPFIPPAIQNTQDHNGNSMAQNVVKKFTDMLASLSVQNDNSHNTSGTVNNPGFMLGAGIHFEAGLDLAVVNANGSLDIGFAALLEHFDGAEATKCSPDGKIGFNNWYAMAICYADLNAELDVAGITVGSVNAGAVLSAGLINPTWASGDLWIDVSALGIIDFTGNVSINIGTSCSIEKDPLDHIRIIGDFGPHGKNGTNVDVTALPYVIGNVPLNKDYTVMVNTGDLRTYRFKVDGFDVTNSNGVALGDAQSKNLNDYEVDILHGNMLCGNASYNAHVTVSAYQVIDNTIGAALVTQDTTFSFTTGPRPQVIQPQNLLYSWPVSGQRYMLKGEFGGTGRLGVAQDVGYLLNPGKADDCGTGGSGGSGSGNASLLAKFIPLGGGDTLQSTFTYDYNKQGQFGVMQFPFPASLKNSSVYTLEIWVVPPPQSAGDASVNTSTVTNTKTQTVTEYTMNSNHNLVATSVTTQVTDTNSVHSLSGVRHMAGADSARVIFSLSFGTSQYNKFADKMTAYGGWGTEDETLYAMNMPIYNLNTAAEPFDELEIKDFKSTCTVNDQAATQIAHLFDADVPWDGNAENDRNAGPIYLAAKAIASVTNARLDLGVPEVRGWFGIPMLHLMSLENMPCQPKLSYTGTLKAGVVSLTTVSASSAFIGDVAYQTPANNGRSMSIQSPNYLGSMISANYTDANFSRGPSAPKPPPGLLWKRDNYFYNDYLLMRDLVDGLSDTSRITSAMVTDLLHGCMSCTVLSVTGYYGSVSITALQWGQYWSSGNQNLQQDVNNFLSQPFTLFPPTPKRTLHFTYSFPSATPVYSAAGYNTSFDYKSIPVVPAQQLNGIPRSGVQTVTVSSKKNPAPPPVIQTQAQANGVLLQRYNIHK
ncbi:MAG TPA: fibronectin type III domain-containing protein [Puia sp.]|jgi:hypothetical protein